MSNLITQPRSSTPTARCSHCGLRGHQHPQMRRPGTTSMSPLPARPASALRYRRVAPTDPPADSATRNGRARRVSDVVTREEIHALEIYRRFNRALGAGCQLAFTLPHIKDRILGVSMTREDTDFTGDEASLIEAARPFLIQAYINATRYDALKRRTAAEATPPVGVLRRLGLTQPQAQACN